MFKRKDKWTEENIPDLTGKIAIITARPVEQTTNADPDFLLANYY